MIKPKNKATANRGPTAIRQFSVTYWIVSLAIVLGMIVSLIVGAKAKDPAILKTFQTFITPLLTFFGGGAICDFYNRIGLEKRLSGDVNKSAYATLSMLQNVLVVENRLSQASDELNENRQNQASTSIQVALAMTTATLRQIAQNLRLWGSLSVTAVDAAKAEFTEDAFIQQLVAGPTRQEIDLDKSEEGQTEETNGN